MLVLKQLFPFLKHAVSFVKQVFLNCFTFQDNNQFFPEGQENKDEKFFRDHERYPNYCDPAPDLN
jgi:hypothetical protein